MFLVVLFLAAASPVDFAAGNTAAVRLAESESLIAFAGPGGIYVMNADGTNRQRLWRGRSPHHPAWSPDGRKLAFDTGVVSPSTNIYVMGADGSNARRLTHDGISAEPTWSPDG